MGIELLVILVIGIALLLALGQAGGANSPQSQPPYSPLGWPSVYEPYQPQESGCVSFLFSVLIALIALVAFAVIFLR